MFFIGKINKKDRLLPQPVEDQEISAFAAALRDIDDLLSLPLRGPQTIVEIHREIFDTTLDSLRRDEAELDSIRIMIETRLAETRATISAYEAAKGALSEHRNHPTPQELASFSPDLLDPFHAIPLVVDRIDAPSHNDGAGI